jgi:gamma-carbonic anhydrase
MAGIDVSNGEKREIEQRARDLFVRRERVCYLHFLLRVNGKHLFSRSLQSAAAVQFRREEIPLVRNFGGRMPTIAASAYVDPQAVVIGDVTLGEHSSIWPCAVARGDCNWIRIGSRTSIQDGSVLHVEQEKHPLIVGDNVTVGHNVILHGCTVESDCLIGMGAIVLNGAKIGAGSVIAAGTVIAEGTDVPPGSLFMGVPGKFRRAVSDAERKRISEGAQHYVDYKNGYKKDAAGGK